jgi:hypothetical protein
MQPAPARPGRPLGPCPLPAATVASTACSASCNSAAGLITAGGTEAWRAPARFLAVWHSRRGGKPDGCPGSALARGSPLRCPQRAYGDAQPCPGSRGAYFRDLCFGK